MNKLLGFLVVIFFFVTVFYTDIYFAKKIEIKSLSKIVNDHSEQLLRLGIDSLDFDICEFDGHMPCFSKVESNLETTSVSYMANFRIGYLGIDAHAGLVAELEKNKWVVYANEDIKSRMPEQVVNDFKHIMNSLINQLDYKQHLAEEWDNFESSNN